MRIASAVSRLTLNSRKIPCLRCGLVMLALCFSACSSDRKPVHPVRGQILVDGHPAANAQVLFHPAESSEDAPRPTGQTDDQGYFHLTSYRNGDGAPEGNYVVTVTWFRLFGDARREVVRYNVLPLHYAAPQSSQLRVSIAKGKNELNALQLHSR